MLAPSYGGTEVAVKVQRPDVRRGVGLDLYLMHGLAHLLRKLPQACPRRGLGLMAFQLFYREKVTGVTSRSGYRTNAQPYHWSASRP